ncbi:MAG TPA: ribosome-associated translation inhibitor RaiA [Candidatus Saccharimonadales bacterium]|nr:ribosome-associated translation inhibitor RaiA [Candidatus Saccharimonadales bacterium]
MIQQLEISAVHFKLDEDLKKYGNKKIGQLDRYVPRNARASVHAEVKLKEAKANHKDRFNCEVILHLPHKTIAISETAINMYAAIDIVETKLRYQLAKYKDLHGNPKLYRRVIHRLNKS